MADDPKPTLRLVSIGGGQVTSRALIVSPSTLDTARER